MRAQKENKIFHNLTCFNSLKSLRPFVFRLFVVVRLAALEALARYAGESLALLLVGALFLDGFLRFESDNLQNKQRKWIAKH